MGRKQKPIDYQINELGCYICTSHAAGKDGYPVIYRDNKQQRMNRYIYKEKCGEIPNGLVVRHKCDNRNCINPEHLELGTQQENVQDMIDRNRSMFFGNSTHKITDDDVREIKRLRKKGLQLIRIAEMFNIHKCYVSQLVNGVRRKQA